MIESLDIYINAWASTLLVQQELVHARTTESGTSNKHDTRAFLLSAYSKYKPANLKSNYMKVKIKRGIIALSVMILACLQCLAANAVTEITVDNIKYQLYDDGTATLSGYQQSPKDVVIPKEVRNSGEAYAVTKVGNKAFKDCSTLNSITLNDVIEIEASAFENCSRMRTVKMPLVTTIGDGAFTNDNYLTGVEMPELKSIGSNAFANCSFLNRDTQKIVN